MFEHYVTKGRTDEDFVANLLIATKGGTITPASLDEDINDHVDFWWQPPPNENGLSPICGIDVKGFKHIRRGDPRINDEDTWIETVNVHGKPGWIYGKATFIAFRRIGKIVFVDRSRLAEYVETKIADKVIVNRNPQCCYVPYRRASTFPPRLDVITLVPLDDIEAISDFVIPHR